MLMKDGYYSGNRADIEDGIYAHIAGTTVE